jgi:hypothetical protein
MHQKSLLSGLLASALALSAAPPQPPPLDPAVTRALAAIRPSELRGDLSFIASDALEGRATPSPGLDIAAEFIASKFRAFGLKPGGNPGDVNNDYFQLAEMVDRKIPKVMTPLMIKVNDGKPITVEPAALWVTRSSAATDLIDAPVLSSPNEIRKN